MKGCFKIRGARSSLRVQVIGLRVLGVQEFRVEGSGVQGFRV